MKEASFQFKEGSKSIMDSFLEVQFNFSQLQVGASKEIKHLLPLAERQDQSSLHLIDKRWSFPIEPCLSLLEKRVRKF